MNTTTVKTAIGDIELTFDRKYVCTFRQNTVELNQPVEQSVVNLSAFVFGLDATEFEHLSVIDGLHEVRHIPMNLRLYIAEVENKISVVGLVSPSQLESLINDGVL